MVFFVFDSLEEVPRNLAAWFMTYFKIILTDTYGINQSVMYNRKAQQTIWFPSTGNLKNCLEYVVISSLSR